MSSLDDAQRPCFSTAADTRRPSHQTTPVGCLSPGQRSSGPKCDQIGTARVRSASSSELLAGPSARFLGSADSAIIDVSNSFRFFSMSFAVLSVIHLFFILVAGGERANSLQADCNQDLIFAHSSGAGVTSGAPVQASDILEEISSCARVHWGTSIAPSRTLLFSTALAGCPWPTLQRVATS